MADITEVFSFFALRVAFFIIVGFYCRILKHVISLLLSSMLILRVCTWRIFDSRVAVRFGRIYISKGIRMSDFLAIFTYAQK